mmetsp:Transcript_3292/g.8393  ORF Transcript_3292/g.8393 Transcript_3292/m.8393 type:complete len:293 (-) Transcript_3292:2123-3001(-)
MNTVMFTQSFHLAILLHFIISAPVIVAMACSSRLANQRVLITGGGRGIGRGIALICSREGANIAIVSRTRSELEETASLAATGDSGSDSPEMSIHVTDVTNSSQVEDAVKSIVSKWGGIDILINNAGGSQKAKVPLWELSSEDLRSMLDLNVVSVNAVTSAVLRQAMLPAGRGKIVNISSRAGKVGIGSYSHYCTSKFALEGMTAALAEEVKDKGIEVNTPSPGMVNTRAFPKPEGKKGVRSVESVEDSLFALINGGVTGHYVHADELDEVRAKGLDDKVALKPIREAIFYP